MEYLSVVLWKNTAEVVTFFDNLFDSVNGASTYNNKYKGKELWTAVAASSKYHIFGMWQLKK